MKMKLTGRILIVLIALSLLITMTACGGKSNDAEKAQKAQEEQKKENDQIVADDFVKLVDALPEDIKLENKSDVEHARSVYDGMSEEQKALVPEDKLAVLEDAELKLEKLEKAESEKKAAKKADRKAAKAVTDAINALPESVKLDQESAVVNARSMYTNLSDKQKKLVPEEALGKLTKAESSIKKLKDKKAAKEKAAKEKKKKSKAKEKEKKTDDKYAIARKYIGKKASALVAKIGAPKKKTKNPNCSTDGEEYVYDYGSFLVGVQSKTMDSPLIVIEVEKA